MSNTPLPDFFDYLKERLLAKLAKAADERRGDAANNDTMAMLSAMLEQQGRINAQLRELLNKRE